MPNPTLSTPRYNVESEADIIQQVNAAFKNYHSVLALARSPLANSALVTPLLVLDDVSPTVDERGHALRLLLQWAVNRLAPDSAPYPLDVYRPYDDPTWRDPHWWRYNILRHRYLEPIHPDEFVEGGRSTETLITLTGIPSADTFFDERNRAVREVAQRLHRQMLDGEANEELQQLALEEAYLPLQSHAAARALLGIAATFDGVFPRSLLLQMAADEYLERAEAALDYLIAERFLLMGDAALNLWLSPVLQKYIYLRQAGAKLRLRHRRAAAYYKQEHNPLRAAFHLQQAQLWAEAAAVLFAAAPDLVNELQIEELCAALLVFKANDCSAEEWRKVQILLSDLFAKSGRQEDAVAACRRALKVTEQASAQASIYRRMGKLYENYNQLHALGYYQQAFERFAPDDPERLDLLKDRAWLYILRQEWSSAEADLALALTQAPTGAKEQRANIYDALASLYRHQQQYTQAIQVAQNALALREEIGDPARVADSFSNLGLIYNYMGEYRYAISTYAEAMKTYHAIGNRPKIAGLLLNIGMAHHLDGQLPAAVQAYNDGLAVCQTIGLPRTEIKAHSNLAEALAELDQTAAAQEHWQAGYNLAVQAGFDEEVRYFQELQSKLPALRVIADPENSGPLPILPAVRGDELAQAEDVIIDLLKRERRITPKLLIEKLHISKATATRRLAELVEQGQLEKRGEGRGTYYVALDGKRPGVASPSSKPVIAIVTGHDQEQIINRLQQQEQQLRQQYNLAGLGLVTSTNDKLLTLVVRFVSLPDLVRFFELEQAVAKLLEERVDLWLEGRLATDQAAALGEILWVWR